MSNKGFVFLDYKKKVVYFAEVYKGETQTRPATKKESEAFITHFYSKGKKTCTFRELKEYVDFHGTRIKGCVYATVNITDKFVYMRLLEKDADLQSAIEAYIHTAREKHRDSDAKRMAKSVTKKLLKIYLKTMLENIDEVFDTQRII